MSGCRLIIGTDQFVEFELECETVGYTLDPDDWSVETALLGINDTYDEDTIPWAASLLVEQDLKIYGQTLLSAMQSPLVEGKYHLLVRATASGASLEAPWVIAKGMVVIEDPLNLGVQEEPEE